jgi:NADPH:quinone reductase-like Zn-dependent oxidoreductase
MAPLQFPSTLGMDFSGVTEKVAEGVSPDLNKVMKYMDKLEY